jgi:hypothetical protein
MSGSEGDTEAQPGVIDDYRTQHASASEMLRLVRKNTASMLSQLDRAAGMGGDITAISGLMYRCEKLRRDQETQQESLDAYRSTVRCERPADATAGEGEIVQEVSARSARIQGIKRTRPSTIGGNTMLRWTPGVIAWPFGIEDDVGKACAA